MAASYAVLYVSFFEGFGLPIVEAFNTQTTIITSNVSSMPEIAGDAALLVNPHSVDEIATAMLKLRWNPDLREQLIEAGKERATLFSWDKTAAAFWRTVEQLMPLIR
jgi:glycosyltransferase involved in cell wall biosynthesis